MNAIRKARIEAGFTQDRLAGIIGVTRVTVTRWESGRVHPSIKMLGVIARALSVQPGDLLDTQQATREACWEAAEAAGLAAQQAALDAGLPPREVKDAVRAAWCAAWKAAEASDASAQGAA